MGCSFVAFLLAIRPVGRIGLREEGRERREREGEEELKSCWRWILLMRPKMETGAEGSERSQGAIQGGFSS